MPCLFILRARFDNKTKDQIWHTVLFCPYLGFHTKGGYICGVLCKHRLQLLFNNPTLEQCRTLSASPGYVFPVLVPVIIHHLIFISSISTVHKNTYNLRSSNQLFQNGPILNLGLALGNLARELHCWVPRFSQKGESATIGTVFNSYYLVSWTGYHRV